MAVRISLTECLSAGDGGQAHLIELLVAEVDVIHGGRGGRVVGAVHVDGVRRFPSQSLLVHDLKIEMQRET